MNKYLVTLRLKGQLIKTVLYAESAIHARLICEFQYGMSCVSSGPTKITSEAQGYPLTDQLTVSPSPAIRPITPRPPKPPKTVSAKPKTPDQMRIAQLKANVDRQKEVLRRERENQRRQREAEQRRREMGGI